MLNKNESLTKKFFERGMWIYAFTFLSAPLGYITRITLTHDLSPEYIGIIYGAIGLLTLLGTYTDFGITESLNYFLPRHIVKDDYKNTKYLLAIAIGVQMVTSTIVSVWLFFLSDWLWVHYFKNEVAGWVLKILSLYFIGVHLMQVNSTFLNAVQNIKAQKTIEFLRLFTTMIGTLILFFSDTGNIYQYTWMWIIGVYIGVIAANIITYRGYYRYFRGIKIQFEKKLLKSFVTYSFATLFTANVAVVLQQVDMQFLTYFIGVRDAGMYSVYLSLINIPFLFLSPLIGFLFPVISELSGRQETKKIQLLHGTFSSYFSSFTLWFAAGFLMIWPHIATLLFWKDYNEAGIALFFISPFILFNILIQINFQILAGTGNIRRRLYVISLTLIYNIFLSLICILGYKHNLIPFPNGSAAASMGVWLSWIPMWYLSQKAIPEYAGTFERNFFLRNIIASLLSIAIYYGFTILVKDIVHQNNLGYEVFHILFAFLLCLTIFLIVNRNKVREFTTIVKSIRAGTYS